MSLRNKAVVITRTLEASLDWGKQLKRYGAVIYNFPTIEIAPVKPTNKLIGILKHVDNFDWVVFTSVNGIRYLSILAKEIDLDMSGSSKWPRVAVIGQRTAKEARSAGFKVAFQPSHPDSQTLGNDLEPVTGKKILLFRTTIASDTLVQQLTGRGAQVTDLPIYQTRLRDDPSGELSQLLRKGRVDYLTFASPSAVQGFCQRLRGPDLKIAKELPAVAIGTSVSNALAMVGFRNVHTASEPSIKGIIGILTQLT